MISSRFHGKIRAMDRPRHLAAVETALRRAPVVAILGPRQVGKTTLALALARRRGRPATRFDLEDPEDLRQLADPKLALRDARGLIILDEIQRRPGLFRSEERRVGKECRSRWSP